MNQEKDLHQKVSMLMPYVGFTSLQSCDKEYLWFISYSAPGVLLQQPKCALLSRSVESDSL